MSKQFFRLVHDTAREMACKAIKEAPNGHIVVIDEQRRSLEANAAMWPILDAFSEQLQWPVNGRMTQMTADEWKDVLTAAFRKEQARLAMGLDGGVVMLGSRTSKFVKTEFSEWLDFLNATAAERGVNLTEYT